MVTRGRIKARKNVLSEPSTGTPKGKMQSMNTSVIQLFRVEDSKEKVLLILSHRRAETFTDFVWRCPAVALRLGLIPGQSIVVPRDLRRPSRLSLISLTNSTRRSSLAAGLWKAILSSRTFSRRANQGGARRRFRAWRLPFPRSKVGNPMWCARPVSGAGGGGGSHGLDTLVKKRPEVRANARRFGVCLFLDQGIVLAP